MKNQALDAAEISIEKALPNKEKIEDLPGMENDCKGLRVEMRERDRSCREVKVPGNPNKGEIGGQPGVENAPRDKGATAQPMRPAKDLPGDPEEGGAKDAPADAPLKIDGDIGPKAAAAFHRSNRYAGPEALSERFGKTLEFLW